MATVGTVEYDARINTRSLARDAKQVERTLEGTADSGSRSAGRLEKSWSTMSKVVTAGLVAASAAVTGFAVKAVKETIDLNESINAVEKTFGDASESIFDFGKVAAKQAGLSKSAFNSAVVPIGAMLQNMGLGADKAADKSINLAKRAADLASVFNTDLSEAMTAIQAALRGEADPIERFGVGMKQSAVEAYALSKGIISAGEEMDQTARATAALGLFFEQTDKFAGDFTDTADAAANKARILKADFENQSAVMGQSLLPAYSALLDLGGLLVTKGMPAVSNFVSSATEQFGKLREGFDQKIGDMGAWFSNISEKASEGDWGAVGRKIGTALADALNIAVERLRVLFEKGMNKLGQIDWVGIGIKLGQNVPALLLGLAAGIATFDIGALFAGIWENLPTILLAGLALALAPAKLIGGIGQILARIPLVGRMLSWLLTSFSSVSSKVFGMAFKVLQIMGRGFLDGLGIVGPSFIGRFTKFLSLIPTHLGLFALRAKNAAAALVRSIGGAIGEGVRPMALRGQQLISGLFNGIKNMFGTALRWVKGIGSWLVGAVGNLSSRLVGHGRSLIQGLQSGIMNRFGGIIGWVAGIPSRISSAVPNMGGILLAAGASIMAGLLAGLRNGWEDVKGFVGGIASWIEENKGPLPYDRKLLVNAGNAIMEGLNSGLNSGFKDVQSNISTMGARLSTNFDVAGTYTARSAPALDSSTQGNSSEVQNNIGTIVLGNDVDVDNFFNRLTRDSEIFSKGMTPKRTF